MSLFLFSESEESKISIQHKDIPDVNLHEPKGVVSAANKTVYHADGAGSGSWQRIYDVNVDYTDKTKNVFGWNDISDNQYTSASPRSISSGVRTQLTNNGLATQSDTSRLGGLWVPASNSFVINDLNAFYVARLAFKVKAAAAAGTPYIVLVELESSNGPTVISGNTQIIKGGNYENIISYTQGFYMGSFINNQSLKLYVTPDTNITLYDIGFVISRTYKET